MSVSAMKQALEALDAYSWEQVDAARAALRQAIEQAEKQKPVAFVSKCNDGECLISLINPAAVFYTAPVHASDTSQEPVDETAKSEHDIWIAAACLKSTVESAIKAGDWKVDGACDPTRDLAYLADCLANPKREWVGLTKDEVDSWELPVVPTVFQFAQFVEAKLKEKNT